MPISQICKQYLEISRATVYQHLKNTLSFYKKQNQNYERQIMVKIHLKIVYKRLEQKIGYSGILLRGGESE